MAELVTVARPYAEAAFKLARETGTLERWSDMLALIEAVVTEEHVAARIGDPNVEDRALESNLVQVLIENGRLELVPHIHTLFDALRREQEGVLDARIISALPIGEEQVQPLLGAIERKYGRKVNAQVEVDPELIGGVRIIVGDKVIDATVRGRLETMAVALMH
nr:ATP synthase delta (OSCP) subunit [uncultured bacterium]